MDVYQDFATDEDKEVNGVWKEVSAGAEALIARSGNKKYARMLAAKVEEHQRVLDLKNEAADTLSDKIMVEVMAETILLGFRGDWKFKGVPQTYSSTSAKLFLTVKDFRHLIGKLSNDFDAYRVKQEEAQVKS